jgi:hypothetical protein
MLNEMYLHNESRFVPMTPESLREHLSHGRVSVSFHKKNGVLRLMNCTTQGNMIPEASRPKVPVPLQEGSIETFNPGPAKDPLLFTVWDLDLGAWRTFKYATLLSVTIEQQHKEVSHESNDPA